MNIFKHKSITIDYDADMEIITQKWIGFSTSAVFQTAINKTIEFVKSNKVKAIISDTLEQSIVGAEDLKYANAGTATLMASGIKAMAFVQPKNVFCESSLKKFSQSNESIKIEVFPSVQQAWKWIDEIVK